MKKLYLFLLPCLLAACSDSFREDLTLPEPNRIIIDYPSVATVTITQTADTTFEYMASTPTETTVSVLNTTALDYDTLDYELFIYKPGTTPIQLNNRALSFRGQFGGTIPSGSSVEGTIANDVNYMLDEDLIKMFFYRVGGLGHLFGGSYTGTYRKLNAKDPATLGTCAMQIDYQGNMRLLFDGSLDSRVLNGFCTEEGEANGPGFNTQVQYDSLASAFKFPLYYTENNAADTIQLNLNRYE